MQGSRNGLDHGSRPKGGKKMTGEEKRQEETPEQGGAERIQQEVDRATNRLGNENKALRQMVETLKREKLTEEEQRRLELEEKEAEIAQRERWIEEKEQRLYAIRAIKEAGLDDGSDKALELAELVMAEKPEQIDRRVLALEEWVRQQVQCQVEKTFRAGGRSPAGGSGEMVENPYSREHYNLTRQMWLETQEPETAKALKAAAQG